MLKFLRDGAKSGFLKFILLGFMAMAVGGLVLTDVGGFFSGGTSYKVVAKGKGLEISTAEFDRTARRILARQGISTQDAYNLGIINQILNNEIQTRLITKEAYKLGINVSDETVIKQISKLAAPLATNGISKKQALQQVLRSQGITENAFVSSIRQEMGNTLFRNALLRGGATISKAQAEDLYQFQNETRNFNGFTLTNKGVKDVTSPTEENLQKFYTANKGEFMISEKRDVTIATLTKEMIADNVKISDEELRKVYEDNIDMYEEPEKRKLQQAILSTQDDAQNVFKRVSKGKTLKAAVKYVTGKKAPYLGENDFEKNGLLEDIATPVFEAEQGDVIGPVQTALGWHVLFLKKIIPPQVESFASAKKNLKDEMLQSRLIDDLVNAANTLDDRLASGEELESVVKEMSLKTETIKGFNQAGTTNSGKDLFADFAGDKAQMLEAAFDFDVGESSPVLELEDGRFVTLRIDNVIERSYTPLIEVKKKLTTRWIFQQKNLTNRARAEDAYAKLKAGSTLADIAKENGASVQKYTKISRNKAPKAPLSYSALRNIFDAKKGDQLKLNIQNGYVIGEVADIALPSIEGKDKEIEELMKQSSDALPQETMAQYINALSVKYNVKINERALKAVYGTPVEN